MNDYLSREQKKTLLAEYRIHNFKRFHSMNAAVKTVDGAFYFASYRIICFRYNPMENTLVVYPYIFDDETFIQTRTTNKQCNRWLYEHFADNGLNTNFLRYLYKQSLNVPPMWYSYNNLKISFADSQLCLNDF